MPSEGEFGPKQAWLSQNLRCYADCAGWTVECNSHDFGTRLPKIHDPDPSLHAFE
jgi:hypothetical protein